MITYEDSATRGEANDAKSDKLQKHSACFFDVKLNENSEEKILKVN